MSLRMRQDVHSGRLKLKAKNISETLMSSQQCASRMCSSILSTRCQGSAARTDARGATRSRRES